jgi:hypothetical protein
MCTWYVPTFLCMRVWFSPSPPYRFLYIWWKWKKKSTPNRAMVHIWAPENSWSQMSKDRWEGSQFFEVLSFYGIPVDLIEIKGPRSPFYLDCIIIPRIYWHFPPFLYRCSFWWLVQMVEHLIYLHTTSYVALCLCIWIHRWSMYFHQCHVIHLQARGASLRYPEFLMARPYCCQSGCKLAWSWQLNVR